MKKDIFCSDARYTALQDGSKMGQYYGANNISNTGSRDHSVQRLTSSFFFFFLMCSYFSDNHLHFFKYL